MAKKNKYLPEQLYDSIETTSEIRCTRCRQTDITQGDESMACDDFFDRGWIATPNHTYCPTCAKKYLKQ